MFKIKVDLRESIIKYYYNDEFIDYNNIEGFEDFEIEECIRDFINIEIEYKLNIESYKLNIEIIK